MGGGRWAPGPYFSDDSLASICSSTRICGFLGLLTTLLFRLPSSSLVDLLKPNVIFFFFFSAETFIGLHRVGQESETQILQEQEGRVE